MGDLWRPALCVSILGFRGSSSPASSRPKLRRRGARRIRDGGPLVVAPRAVSFEGLRHPAYLSGTFPALTVVFLLPSLFGQQYTTLLVAFLMFGFEVVNLLLIITCAVYTIETDCPPSPLYALCIGPVLLSMAVGSGLAELLGPGAFR